MPGCEKRQREIKKSNGAHTEALKGNENLDELEEGEYFGFNVDAGLGTIVDVQTRDAFCGEDD
ncbi:DUF4241 domain-containing protein [Breznakiella homolactica]|uniref:DUF4241 domain-containing protein n=1 Tax=Breznakiella homolactica TaxID=2798577 RepID=A0A7T7XRW5_9SPIR|nr:DUF4241 domain-containing protein [Breznakiella homolactica]